jgi:hypothetical protein
MTFELDAWELGLGGFQDVDGRDLRNDALAFPARLTNGKPESLTLEVRTSSVRAIWNDRVVSRLELAGKRLTVNPLWQTQPPALPGLGSWKSPTLFESIDYRVVE